MLKNINKHSPLTVKKEEAASGAAWNDLAKTRSKQQHGDSEEIPAGDHHAVHTQDFGPNSLPRVSPEETQEALNSLENQIKKLQEEEKNRPAPPPPPARSAPQSEDLDDLWGDE